MASKTLHIKKTHIYRPGTFIVLCATTKKPITTRGTKTITWHGGICNASVCKTWFHVFARNFQSAEFCFVRTCWSYCRTPPWWSAWEASLPGVSTIDLYSSSQTLHPSAAAWSLVECCRHPETDEQLCLTLWITQPLSSSWVPLSHYSWGNRSISRSGPSLWNSLPIKLRKETSYLTFKNKLTTHLFQ